MRYHLSEKTKIPNRCADSYCILEHFETREEAFAAFKKLKNDELEKDHKKKTLSAINKNSFKSESEVEVPAGKYWFGDPSYVFNNELWAEFVSIAAEETNDFEKPIAGVCVENNIALMVNTLYGDGLYEGNNNVSYGVDSGSLGLVHEYFVSTDRDDLGTWHFLQSQTILKRTKDGEIVFGGFSIKTGD